MKEHVFKSGGWWCGSVPPNMIYAVPNTGMRGAFGGMPAVVSENKQNFIANLKSNGR